MESLQAIILGLVQGLGEFLPISSTAHLVLAPYFFGWQDPGLAFDVALHLGTLIAVVGFFWKDWVEIFELAFKNQVQSFPPQRDPAKAVAKFKVQGYRKNILWLLIIATIPGVLAGYFLEAKAETIFRSPLIIAGTLFLAGLVLYLADKYLQHRKNLKQVDWKDSLIMGLSQAVAIIPGVSRSGATITAGLFLGLSRSSAARFSFLLSTPIILGATIFKMPELLQNGINWPIILGVLVSALSGYLAIKYLLLLIEKVGYGIFFWYRTLLALLIIFVYFLK
ncbi:undecaprenyl-diphosphate phosphatase [Patescibacteria group bacterium]|nr:undecaprenyl-diphosphate phosphatase [Patescibacteria group bacterium]